MTKYQEYFNKMIADNKQIFEDFTTLHQNYYLDQNRYQKQFNDEGQKVVDIVRDYENRLCANTERGMYNKYSGGLSEKFWGLIRKNYPLIDNVGLIVDEPQHPGFNIKKISF